MKKTDSPDSVRTIVTMNRVILGIGFLAILALAIFRFGYRERPNSPLKIIHSTRFENSPKRVLKDPLVYGTVPDFSLTAQDGNPVSKAGLLGHPWIADFIFTRCAGQCPRMSTTMAALQSDFRSLQNLRFVSFSIDPKWDTPDVLTKYAHSYGADPKRWLFVTGSVQDVYRLSRQGFKLGVDENAPDAPNIAVEPILHSSSLVLVDTDGNIRGYYDGTEVQAMKRLRIDARKIYR